MTLENQLENLAADLGRLRKATLETPFDWQVDRLCEQMYWLLPRKTPSAGQLCREGLPVEVALVLADREDLRVRRLLGEPQETLRQAGLIA